MLIVEFLLMLLHFLMLTSIYKKGDEVSLKVKKGLECVSVDREDASSTFDLTVSEGVLSVKLKKDPDNISGPYGDYSIYIRLNEVCVRVIMSVV